MSKAQRAAVSDLLFIDLCPVGELHHGDCVGADKQSHGIAHNLSIPVVVHPPINAQLRAWCAPAAEYRPPKEYLSRNVDIVDETDALIAAPYQEDEIGGTWFTVRYARQQGKPIAIVYRSGLVRWERMADIR
jgi:hypothetical protein